MMMGTIMSWLDHHFMISFDCLGQWIFALWVIPGSSAVGKGRCLGVAAWLGMMVMVYRWRSAGLFSMNMGMMAPIADASLHIVLER
jgi:hypothetical protein